MDRTFQTSFLERLCQSVMDKGGFWNAHLHLDRAETFDATAAMLDGQRDAGVSSLGLSQKHGLIPMIHASECYDPDALEARVGACVDKMAALGTVRADSVVDVTADRVGLTALERLRRIADRARDQIDFRVGAYNPLGFRDDAPERWELIERAAPMADFIGGLPERDDRADYPDHIGFAESCRRVIALAHALGKPLHLHVDQKNHDREAHTEEVIRIVRDGGFVQEGAEPFIWLVHVISPSAYDDARFNRIARALAELNIGVICCPLAALSMRQIRGLPAPTHNSIARVLELLAAGVPVRLGSDNVCDITSPAGTLDMMDEMIALAHALRFFDIDILASLGAGQVLTDAQQDRVIAHLADDRAQSEQALR